MIENWIQLVIGILVLISPWLFGFAYISLAQWSNVVCGMVLIVMNAWAIFGKDPGAEAPSGLESVSIQKPKRTRRVIIDSALASGTPPAVKSKRVKK